MNSVAPGRPKANPHLFFEAGEVLGAPGLVAARCGDCGRHTLARPLVCGHCFGRNLTTVAAGQAGQVTEASVVHHPAGGFTAPYVIALIRTDEGLTLFAPMRGDPAAIRPGARVRFTLFDRPDDTTGFAYIRADEGTPHVGS